MPATLLFFVLSMWVIVTKNLNAGPMKLLFGVLVFVNILILPIFLLFGHYWAIGIAIPIKLLQIVIGLLQRKLSLLDYHKSLFYLQYKVQQQIQD